MNSNVVPHIRGPVLALGALLIAGWMFVKGFKFDDAPLLSPPAQIFAETMGRPMPAGVSGLKLASRQVFIKSWVWMHFQASDSALNTLLPGAEKLDAPEGMERALKGDHNAAKHWHDAADKLAVDWDEVAKIRHPEVYRTTHLSDDSQTTWTTEIIVDRPHHQVFVSSAGD